MPRVPLNSTTAGELRATMPPVKVYVRQRWASAWQELANFYCDTLTLSVSPEVSRATFSWRYGVGRYPEEQQANIVSPQDLLDSYVKVEIGDPDLDDPILVDDDVIRWYGVFSDQQRHDEGEMDFVPPGQNPSIPGNPRSYRVPTGRQTFVALGLEHLLERCYWDGSVCESGEDVDEPDEPRKERWLPRPLGFNNPHTFVDAQAADEQRNVCGDRTLQPGPKGAHLFASDLKNAVTWSTTDCVRYLLTYHGPRTMAGDDSLRIAVEEETWGQMPTWDRPVITCEAGHDPNLKELLDQLFDRRRMFCWWLDVVQTGGEEITDDETGETWTEPIVDVLVLKVATFVDELLWLSGAESVPANPDQVRLDVSRAFDVEVAVLGESSRSKVDRVVVRGARKRSMCTIHRSQDSLIRGWKSEDLTAYRDGPTGIATMAYAAAREAIEKWRAQEKFARVGRYYNLAEDFEGLVNSYSGSPGSTSAWPDDQDEEWGTNIPQLSSNSYLDFYRPRARLARRLFRGVLPDRAPDLVADHEPAVLAFCRAGATGSDPWVQMDKMGGDGYRTSTAIRAVDFSFSVRVQPDDAGVILTAHGTGAMQHALLYGEGWSNTVWEQQPPMDEDFLLTCVLEQDLRVQVGYPALADLDGLQAEVPRVEVIDVGDRARWDYVPKGTVIGCTDGVLESTTEDRTMRDDREWMRNLARWVYEWYGRRRQAFSFKFRQVSDILRRGQLITEVGTGDNVEPVRSVVTQVHYDLVRGATEVSTSYAELDLTRL